MGFHAEGASQTRDVAPGSRVLIGGTDQNKRNATLAGGRRARRRNVDLLSAQALRLFSSGIRSERAIFILVHLV